MLITVIAAILCSCHVAKGSVLVGHLKKDTSEAGTATKYTGGGDRSGKPVLTTFSSQNEPRSKTFNAAEDGRAECLETYPDVGRADLFTKFQAPMASVAAKKQSNLTYVPEEETRMLHPGGYMMRVYVFFDDKLVKRFGTVERVLKRILPLLQETQNKFGMASLTTKILFNFTGTSYVASDNFSATEADLFRLGPITTLVPESDVYVFLGHKNDRPGLHGISYIATTCGDKLQRIVIVYYYLNDQSTSSLLAHEIGHNLGMQHDFIDGTDAPKFASDGTPCTGIHGVMDYNTEALRWSKCSVDDFTKYHDSIKPFCLPKLP